MYVAVVVAMFVLVVLAYLITQHRHRQHEWVSHRAYLIANRVRKQLSLDIDTVAFARYIGFIGHMHEITGLIIGEKRMLKLLRGGEQLREPAEEYQDRIEQMVIEMDDFRADFIARAIVASLQEHISFAATGRSCSSCGSQKFGYDSENVGLHLVEIAANAAARVGPAIKRQAVAHKANSVAAAA
jgi:hypothetical protein